MIKLKSGDKYGKLTLLKSFVKREKRKNNNGVNTTFWKCKCDCGNIKENIREDHIISGRSASCGCSKKNRGHKNQNASILTKDFLFEQYIELKKSTPNIAKEIGVSCSWIEIKLKQFNINKRTAKENGFPNKAKENSINALWKGYEEISLSSFNNIKNGAIDRNIEFYITIEDAWNQFIKQERKCALTGLSIGFIPKGTPRKYKLWQTASLDRIDSSKPYTIDNIQWVHKDINQMKWQFNQQKFIEYCKLVSNYNKGD